MALAQAQQVSSHTRDQQPGAEAPSSAEDPAIPPPILTIRNTKHSSPAPVAISPDTPSIKQLRTDLSTAQAARSTLTKENTELNTQLGDVTATISTLRDQLKKLQAQSNALTRRLKDRDSEISEKRKMLESVQDEMVGLEMQLNVAEAEKGKLRGENEELVRRLVKENEAEIEERMKAQR